MSAEFAKQKRAKSPPLAFEKTPNDALVPRQHVGSEAGATDIHSPNMGRWSPRQPREANDLQVIINQQATAINKLHDAFAAERQVWIVERERLYQRIASLEKLLKTGDGYR